MLENSFERVSSHSDPTKMLHRRIAATPDIRIWRLPPTVSRRLHSYSRIDRSTLVASRGFLVLHVAAESVLYGGLKIGPAVECKEALCLTSSGSRT